MAEEADQPGITLLNRERGIAVTDDDAVVQLRGFIDEFGDYCDSDDGICAVGVDSKGRWWSIYIGDGNDEVH